MSKLEKPMMVAMPEMLPSSSSGLLSSTHSPQTDMTDKLNVHDLDSVKINVPTVYPISDLTLYIDPIDATKEFTEGYYSNVTILIGIAYKSDPIAGVVYQPWSEDKVNSLPGLLVWGIVGHGIDGSLVHTREFDIDKLIVATTRSHLSDIITEGLQKLKPAQVLRVGGCGYKILIVITGKADVYYYPSRGTNKWDTCGPDALLRCVGGTLTDVEGNSINYNRDQPRSNDKGVIVTLRHHEEVLKRLKA